MKTFILTGPAGAGKTTLCTALMNPAAPVRKTQAMQYHGEAVDSPGEFFENPRLYRALLSEIPRAGIILYVHPADRTLTQFPPGLLQVHGKEIWAVISKTDLAEPGTVLFLKEELKKRGFSRVFNVDTSEASRKELAEALEINLEEKDAR